MMMIRISKYFGLSVDYLIGNDVGGENLVYVPNHNKGVLEKNIEDGDNDLIAEILNLDKNGLKAVESFLKVYKEQKK